MTDYTAKTKSPLRWLWTLVKIVAVIAVLIFVVVTVLSKLGGNSDTLRNAVEQFLKDSTGMPTQIGRLNNLSFYPTIGVDVEQIEFAKTSAAEPVAIIDTVQIGMDFWDVVRSTGRVKEFNIQNARIIGGIITEETLFIETIAIQDDATAPEKGTLVLRGKLGEKLLTADASLAAYGEGARRSYDLGRDRTIDLKIGDLTLQGQMKNPSLASVTVENLLVKQGEQHLLSGTFSAEGSMSGRQITGDLKFGQASQIQPNIQLKSTGISGTITSPRLLLEDVAGAQAVIAELTKIVPQKPNANEGKIDLGTLSADITVDLKSIESGGNVLGNQNLTISLKDKAIIIDRKSGNLLGHPVSWVAKLTPSGEAYTASFNAKADNMLLQKVQESLGGKADIDLAFDTVLKGSSTSSTWDGLTSNVNGDFAFTTQNGRFDSRLVDVWGNGLASLIVPSFRPSDEAQMRCAIIHASITNGIATLQTFYADTARVTLTGTGDYNITKNKLDMKLSPKTKDLSIGDISAGIIISGPIEKPRISASTRDIGKKAIGALLGSVNPAFLALSAADVSVGDDDVNPCESVEALADGNKAVEFVKTAKPVQPAK